VKSTSRDWMAYVTMAMWLGRMERPIRIGGLLGKVILVWDSGSRDGMYVSRKKQSIVFCASARKLLLTRQVTRPELYWVTMWKTGIFSIAGWEDICSSRRV
jgi:hypothetical protein